MSDVPAVELGSVFHAYVHSENEAHSWHISMKQVEAYDRLHNQRLRLWGAQKYGTEGLPSARNMVVVSFLESDAEWLWWTDTDMGFDATSLERLVQSADPDFHPVMGGLCFVWKEIGHDGMNGMRHVAAPTLFDWRENPDGTMGFIMRKTVPREPIVQVAGTGSAFIIIHRRVMETIRDKHGPVWYSRLTNPSTHQLIAEDLSFCARCQVLNIPVHVNTTVTTNHQKTIWVGPQDALYES